MGQSAADVLSSCSTQLSSLYDRLVDGGMSRHEYSVEQLMEAISRIRKIENNFRKHDVN